MTSNITKPAPTYAGQDLPAEVILDRLLALTALKKVTIHRRKPGADWVMDVGPDTWSSPNFNHMIHSAAMQRFPLYNGSQFQVRKQVDPSALLTSRGSEHIHKTHGRVMVIHCHPYDGAALIIERMETTDPDDDDLVLDKCERSDLGPPLHPRTWPFLGFTTPTAKQGERNEPSNEG